MCSPVLPERRSGTPWLDRLGMAASTLCAMHCAATALMMGALSAIGAGALGHPLVEAAFLAASVGLGAVSLGHALRRHRSWRPALWFIAGLILLLAVRPVAEGPALEVAVVMGGALCVVRAHWKNARLLLNRW